MRYVFAILVIINAHIWYTIASEPPTHWTGKCEDGTFVHINQLTERVYHTKDTFGLQILKRAQCTVLNEDGTITAFVGNRPVATIQGERAHSEESWRSNITSNRKQISL